MKRFTRLELALMTVFFAASPTIIIALFVGATKGIS